MCAQHTPSRHTRTPSRSFHAVPESPRITPLTSCLQPGLPLLPLPTGPLRASRSSTPFEFDRVVSGASGCDLRGCDAEGEAGSGDSGGQGGLSVVDFGRSLEPSFFGLMSLTKALAPIQWFFLVRSRFLGHDQPSLPLQQVTGCPD